MQSNLNAGQHEVHWIKANQPSGQGAVHVSGQNRISATVAPSCKTMKVKGLPGKPQNQPRQSLEPEQTFLRMSKILVKYDGMVVSSLWLLMFTGELCKPGEAVEALPRGRSAGRGWRNSRMTTRLVSTFP